MLVNTVDHLTGPAFASLGVLLFLFVHFVWPTVFSIHEVVEGNQLGICMTRLQRRARCAQKVALIHTTSSEDFLATIMSFLLHKYFII